MESMPEIKHAKPERKTCVRCLQKGVRNGIKNNKLRHSTIKKTKYKWVRTKRRNNNKSILTVTPCIVVAAADVVELNV